MSEEEFREFRAKMEADQALKEQEREKIDQKLVISNFLLNIIL